MQDSGGGSEEEGEGNEGRSGRSWPARLEYLPKELWVVSYKLGSYHVREGRGASHIEDERSGRPLVGVARSRYA